MKPIEAGCLAIIVNSTAGNNGICVSVISYIADELPDMYYPNIWKVDKEINYIGDSDKGYRIHGKTSRVAERYLMRIDGGEFEEDKELMEIMQ